MLVEGGGGYYSGSASDGESLSPGRDSTGKDENSPRALESDRTLEVSQKLELDELTEENMKLQKELEEKQSEYQELEDNSEFVLAAINDVEKELEEAQAKVLLCFVLFCSVLFRSVLFCSVFECNSSLCLIAIRMFSIDLDPPLARVVLRWTIFIYTFITFCNYANYSHNFYQPAC